MMIFRKKQEFLSLWSNLCTFLIFQNVVVVVVVVFACFTRFPVFLFFFFEVILKPDIVDFFTWPLHIARATRWILTKSPRCDGINVYSLNGRTRGDGQDPSYCIARMHKQATTRIGRF